MKPRPFYRWKSFWLGLCVLVFLGWAWWASFRSASMVWAVGAGRKVAFARGYGVTHVKAGATSKHRWDVGALRNEMIWTEGEFRDNAASGQFKVRDSLFFFSSSALWLAWLFWHWKREQKKL